VPNPDLPNETVAASLDLNEIAKRFALTLVLGPDAKEHYGKTEDEQFEAILDATGSAVEKARTVIQVAEAMTDTLREYLIENVIDAKH
jgi:hypothetical protein